MIGPMIKFNRSLTIVCMVGTHLIITRILICPPSQCTTTGWINQLKTGDTRPKLTVQFKNLRNQWFTLIGILVWIIVTVERHLTIQQCRRSHREKARMWQALETGSKDKMMRTMKECLLDLIIHISNGKDQRMHQIPYKASKNRSMTFHKSITIITIFAMITKKNNLNSLGERECLKNHHKDKSTNTITNSSHLPSQNKHLLTKLMMLSVSPVPKMLSITLIIISSSLNTKATINPTIIVLSSHQITFNHPKLQIWWMIYQGQVNSTSYLIPS